MFAKANKFYIRIVSIVLMIPMLSFVPVRAQHFEGECDWFKPGSRFLDTVTVNAVYQGVVKYPYNRRLAEYLKKNNLLKTGYPNFSVAFKIPGCDSDYNKPSTDTSIDISKLVEGANMRLTCVVINDRNLPLPVTSLTIVTKIDFL